MEHDALSSNGSLVAIWAKQERGQPMRVQGEAALEPGTGLSGSAPTRGKRQVTLLAREAWERAAAEAGLPGADPVTRRANLLVTGVDFHETAGRTLAVGDARILIHGETKACGRVAEGALLDALAPEWRAGAFGEVVAGGPIRVGDSVAWVESATS